MYTDLPIFTTDGMDLCLPPPPSLLSIKVVDDAMVTVVHLQRAYISEQKWACYY